MVIMVIIIVYSSSVFCPKTCRGTPNGIGGALHMCVIVTIKRVCNCNNIKNKITTIIITITTTIIIIIAIKIIMTI